MRLLHYSRFPLRLPLVDCTAHQRFGPKPIGLWVSVEGEDDWPSWCRAESFAEESLRSCSEIVLAEGANVLTTPFPSDLREFERDDDIRGYMRVDWNRVAERYQGVIIAPYSWPDRMEVDWYYGWDCASGCIWDPAAIASIARIEQRAAEVLAEVLK